MLNMQYLVDNAFTSYDTGDGFETGQAVGDIIIGRTFSHNLSCATVYSVFSLYNLKTSSGLLTEIKTLIKT